MIILDKKKSVSAILSRLRKDGSTLEAEVEQESSPHDEYTAFAEEMISAFQSGSVQRLSACLKEFHEMIEDKDEEQDAKEG
jgi:hypothetical protein